MYNLLYDLDLYDTLTRTLQERGVNVSFNDLISEWDQLSNNTVAQITETERTRCSESTNEQCSKYTRANQDVAPVVIKKSFKI